MLKLVGALTRQAMHKSAMYLQSQDISPHLAEMAGTLIPVPGQEFLPFNEKIVTVHKMHKMAFVLPTKTRPKKISFTGSDGKE